ncbi:unnamed protein product [Oppiella nova]|uniref:diphosphoinositol-polyphosphate diphosphatase n=1 Tax=Oppiella nova TaxID=334625 RepID=A0A7R9MCP5_9ACAR|nr:unnamed protein product [Oppiella nova]CAG2173688.1 unnamed protein product [Oppiella nova]
MVKEKPNSTRTYDEEGFRRRAACLCVRDDHQKEILLVTSSRAGDRWIVPGGGLEPNEDPSSAAIRETIEEAGVKGVIRRCLGTFENSERKHRTSVFVMHVTEELEEWEDSQSRKRNWFSIEEALKLLAIHKPVQTTYVKLLVKNDSLLSSS